MKHFLQCFYDRWQRNEVALRAAALTYYAVFSMFPLLLLVTSGVGWLLRDPAFQRQVWGLVMEFLPRGSDVFTRLLQEIVLAHALPNYLAGLTLLWSAAGFLRGLLTALDVIHNGRGRRGGWWVHLWSVGLVALLVPGLLGTATLVAFIARLVASLPWVGYSPFVAVFTHRLTLWGIASAAFYALFRLMARERPPRRASALAGGVTGALWLGLNVGFGQYLTLAFQRLNFIYGSLAVVVALMLYFYLVNIIILTGAQFHALLHRLDQCTPHPLPWPFRR